LLSGIVESLLGGGDECVKRGLRLGGLVELSLGWCEVVEGPLLSGIVEGLLGLNGLLGGEGGGQNGSGSSGCAGCDRWYGCGIGGNGLVTQFPGGNDSGGLLINGGLECVTSIDLSTSKWGNLSGEISEEGSGTGEIGVGGGGLFGGNGLPSLDGIELLLGSSEEVDLAGLGGFSSTDGSGAPGAGGLLGGLLALITSEGEVLSESSGDPVGEPEVDLSGGPGGLHGSADGCVTSASVSEASLGGGGVGSNTDVTVGVGTTLEKGMELLGAGDAVVEVAPGSTRSAVVISGLECTSSTSSVLPACNLHHLSEEELLLPVEVVVECDQLLAAIRAVELS